MLTPVISGKQPRDALDLTMMGIHSVVPHTPVAFDPHACPIRTVVVPKPFAAALSMIYGMFISFTTTLAQKMHPLAPQCISTRRTQCSWQPQDPEGVAQVLGLGWGPIGSSSR